MLSNLMLLFALCSSLAFGVPCTSQNHFSSTDIQCATGVHIIGIRGTLEESGYGALGPIVDTLISQIPGSDGEAVEYPADGIDIIDGKIVPRFFEYTRSEAAGVRSFTDAFMDYFEACPDTKFVLLGYSQGAHVMGDILCGTSSYFFAPTPPIDPFLIDNVIAIVQLGDPTDVAGIGWHYGTGTRKGIFPRRDFSTCAYYADRWQSWCDADDIFCDSQGGIDVHLGYVERYSQNITDFIISQYKASSSTNGRHYELA